MGLEVLLVQCRCGQLVGGWLEEGGIGGPVLERSRGTHQVERSFGVGFVALDLGV